MLAPKPSPSTLSEQAVPLTVCVQGLGFVGAAMAVAVASAKDEQGRPRYMVHGIDLPSARGRQRIDALSRGKFPFESLDRDLALAAAAAHRQGNLLASHDPDAYAQADIIIVDVNLDLNQAGDEPAVDFAPFRQAIQQIARHMRPGTLVIVETTVPPGTCAKVVAPALAAGLRERGRSENDFLLAHSYERVMPGEGYFASITNFWRVYAGHTPEAAEACERFLSTIINVRDYPLTRLASTTASETAKVLENSYRAANIAFIEEWGRFAERVGVDLFEVIRAIRVRPTHSNIRQPGFGVGGYCLTKDPLFGQVSARDLFGRTDLKFPFSSAAVDINRRMPLASVRRLEEMLGGSLQSKRILLLGVTYRQDVADTRDSPSQVFLVEAQGRGAKVLPHDPLVRHWEELDMQVLAELPSAADVDAVVLAVPHRSYASLALEAWVGPYRPMILDANDVLSARQRELLHQAGCRVEGIGRG